MRPNPDKGHASTRWLIFTGLAAFVPLFYYLAVVGGFLPYGGILVIGLRHLTDSSFLLFSSMHLAVYGVLLYWLSGLIARALDRLAGKHVWPATAGVLLVLAGVGALPIYGIAHGNIKWTNAYALYGAGNLR